MSDSFAPLLIASALFLLTHFGLSIPAVRDPLRGALGEKGFLIVYSLIAVITLAWLVAEYNAAPTAVLWTAPALLRRLPALLMPIAFFLVVAGVTTRNPTSVGGDPLIARADSVRGVLRITRHPVMWGVTLWALVHLIVNGEVAAQIFFGTMLLLALLGTYAIDHKKRLALGENWARFAAVTSHVPFAAIAAGRNRLVWREIGAWRVFLALAFYAAFALLHARLFGAPPY